MASNAPIFVSVVYSPVARACHEVRMSVPCGATVGQALEGSGLLELFALSQLSSLDVGVWGRKVSLLHKLLDNDRVEIYRPLRIDPKVARRERFAHQGVRSAGLFVQRRTGAKAGY